MPRGVMRYRADAAAVGAVCGRICYTLHKFPKQRNLILSKTCYLALFPSFAAASETFMGTENLLWIVLQSRVSNILFRDN